MTLDGLGYIRDHYHVPARAGGRIRFTREGTHEGTILGSCGGENHLRVQFDDSQVPGCLHPTWHVEYLDSVAS